MSDVISSSETHKVTIVCSVTTTVRLEDGESPDDLSNRYVDIYLHAAGENGYANKKDLGADNVHFVKPVGNMVLVDESLLKGLIATARLTTDLEGVYNDDDETFYRWDDVMAQATRLL